jgi:hypothetical protein
MLVPVWLVNTRSTQYATQIHKFTHIFLRPRHSRRPVHQCTYTQTNIKRKHTYRAWAPCMYTDTHRHKTKCNMYSKQHNKPSAIGTLGVVSVRVLGILNALLELYIRCVCVCVCDIRMYKDVFTLDTKYRHTCPWKGQLTFEVKHSRQSLASLQLDSNCDEDVEIQRKSPINNNAPHVPWCIFGGAYPKKEKKLDTSSKHHSSSQSPSSSKQAVQRDT